MLYHIAGSDSSSLVIWWIASHVSWRLAIKKTFHEKQMKVWMQEWRELARGKRAIEIDKTTLSKTFLLAISKEKISRNAASRIAQLHLNHAPVNHFLKRIGRMDSARCPACGADDEMVKHFLIACPIYAHKRWPLEQLAKKRQKQLMTELLLEDKQMTIPLAKFIEAMHRFNSGEQTTQHERQST